MIAVLSISARVLAGELVLGVTLGVAIGAAHYLLLWRNVETFASGSTLICVLLPFGRFAATGTGLYLASRMGAPALGAAVLGLLAARHFVVRRIGKT